MRDERYPNREAAAQFARANKLPEEAIAAELRVSLKSDEDPLPEWWYGRMKARADTARLGLTEIGVAATEEDAEALRPGPPKRK